MKKLRSAQILIYIYCTLLIVSALFVLGWMLFSPSEPGNAILFGLSLPRLVFVLGLLIAIMILGIVIMKAGRDQIWAEKFLERWFGEGRYSKILSWLAGISFGLGWIALFLPIDRVGPFVNYWMRIRPAMVFILLAGIITLIMFIVRRGTFSFSELKKSKTLKLSIILFVFSLPIFGWMLYSRFGISMPEDFWYNAGVPVLVSQLIGAIFGGVIFLHIQQNRKFKRFDLVVFVLIFAATALLWAHEPLQKGFSFVGPYLPNDVYYPLFDAGVFDSASQFPLIGQNIFIFNGNFFERPLYLSFLVYLHSLFGQDYETLMAAQAGVFAIFPPLIYLIGRSLNMRVVGFTAALVAMLRGINSIAASNMMDLANPKMMLTDFPAAIGVALIILLTCEWLKSTETKPQYALGLGGVLGFALMLRTNALILMALIPLFALVKFAPKWKDWLAHCVLIVIGVLAITLPWELRNHSLGGQMYSGIIFKFQGVIDQRYSPPEPAGLAPHMDNKLFTLESTKVVSTFLQDDYLAQDSFPCNSIFCFVPNHFLHNIFTSILIIPPSPFLDNLRSTVLVNNPYWNQHWDGTFTLPSLILLVANIFIILLGISFAWKKHRLPGITPLAIYMFYNLSNAFARTSGGRYIVPMDWIITIYFLAGIFYIIIWFANSVGKQWKIEDTDLEKITPVQVSSPKFSYVLIALLGLGTLVPLSERLHPDRYQSFDIDAALTQYDEAMSSAGLTKNLIETFLLEKNAEVIVGRALYPRHYKKDRGENIFFYPTIPLPFPRTTFTLIGPGFNHGIVLPGDVPQYFPHASDVIVIGCREIEHVDALAVIILDSKDTVYTRVPESPMTCPLQQPVCNNNSVCE